MPYHVQGTSKGIFFYKFKKKFGASFVFKTQMSKNLKNSSKPILNKKKSGDEPKLCGV